MKEIYMTTTMLDLTATMMFAASELAEQNELVKGQLAEHQLVRGQDAALLERVGPLVRERNITLDMAGVERIDAAGITALVALYRSAWETGHRFSVTNVSARVAQILSVVGLDRFLVSHNAVPSSRFGSRVRRAAA
jgi:anti-anti-sigma factor